MTLLASKTDVGQSAAGVAIPRRSNPRRRSPAMVSLGVVLVVIGALAAWQYVSAAGGDTKAYLAVYRPVPLGAQLTADDLQVVNIPPVQGLTPMSASDLSDAVGQYAKVELVPGTLLTATELVATNVPPTDKALVGLLLKPAQRPGRSLRAGDHVQLVPLPDSSSEDQSGAGMPPPKLATVFEVFAPDADGSTVVDVLVASADARTIASLGNAGRIAIILVPGS